MSVRKILLCYQPDDSLRASKIKKMKNFEQPVVFAEEDWPTVANHSEIKSVFHLYCVLYQNHCIFGCFAAFQPGYQQRL